MSSLFNGSMGQSGVDTGDIGHSLRWRRSASPYIATGVTTAATSTYFAFFKQGALDAINPIFDGNIKINANNTVTAFGLTTTAVKRDPTSHHWIHVSNNGLVIDGQNLGAVTTSAITNLRIGYDGTNYADMYGARFVCVSGSSLPYTDFVYFNTEINEWVTKSQSAIKALADSGGASSFFYDFDNGTSLTTLGHDKSSKGNNATLNNFSLTAGSTYDWMLDVPGNSYATWNPLFPTTNTISNGNLRGALAASVNAGYGIRSTIPMVSGKYEAEFVPAASADSWSYVGVCPASLGISDVSIVGSNAVLYRAGNGNKNVSGTATAYGASWTTEAIRVAVDMDARTVTFYKAGASQGSISLPSGTENYIFVMANGNATTFTADANFGQQPITLDSGYKALCQRNMPDPAILNPEKHFDVRTRTGTGGASTISGIGFPPELIWTKCRNNTWHNTLSDIVRGTTKFLESSTTDAEGTDAQAVTAFNSDGYSLGSFAQVNLGSETYVDWLWKAGGAPVTNNAGSISSQVSANVEAGFSIVTYTGTGANATVGHGLGVAPKLHVNYRRGSTGANHFVYHASVNGGVNPGNYYLILNSTSAAIADSIVWNNTAPNSNVFALGSTGEVNANTYTYVSYCFAEIPGFSKIFSYTGNGSADGPFVHCGFKPKFILYKRSDAAANWIIWDAIRSPENVVNDYLLPNSSAAEAALDVLDIVSNGFKLRTTNADNNGGTIVGIAFADVPAKYSLGR